MKKLIVALVGMVFIVGCGGSGGDKSKTIAEQMQERDVINIFYNYPTDLCAKTKEVLASNPKFKDLLVASSNDSVSCASFGKEIGDSCGVAYKGFNTSKSCVFAWNKNK